MRKDWLKNACLLVFIGATIVCTVVIGQAWVTSSVPPFINYYETLLLLAWSISLISLIYIIRFSTKFIGLGASVSVVGLLLVAVIKKNSGYATVLPELSSGLLLPHILSMFLAYGFLIVAALFSIKALFFSSKSDLENQVTINKQDALIPRSLVWYGFTLLLLGTFLGILWSQFSWNNYWTWDPKQSWTLTTILLFASYLLLSTYKVVNTKVLHWLAILGLLAILMTYLGIGYIGVEDTHIRSFLSIK
jgi:ABC-type transport system involved in cytochrome c biogenesis permease subunit